MTDIYLLCPWALGERCDVKVLVDTLEDVEFHRQFDKTLVPIGAARNKGDEKILRDMMVLNTV